MTRKKAEEGEKINPQSRLFGLAATTRRPFGQIRAAPRAGACPRARRIAAFSAPPNTNSAAIAYRNTSAIITEASPA